VRAAAATKGT